VLLAHLLFVLHVHLLFVLLAHLMFVLHAHLQYGTKHTYNTCTMHTNNRCIMHPIVDSNVVHHLLASPIILKTQFLQVLSHLHSKPMLIPLDDCFTTYTVFASSSMVYQTHSQIKHVVAMQENCGHKVAPRGHAITLPHGSFNIYLLASQHTKKRTHTHTHKRAY